MPRKRYKVIFRDGAFRVDLPEYQMISGTFRPIIPGIIHADGVFPGVDMDAPQLNGLTVEVEIPERLLNPETGNLDKGRMNAVYRGHPKWGDLNFEPDI